MSESKLCPFGVETSVYGFLIDLVSSKAIIKKFKLSKKFLEKKSSGELRLPMNLVNFHMINPEYTGPKIDILMENEFFIAVNKPSGIHGHPQTYEEKDTVLNFLRASSCIPILGQRQQSPESHLLFRLDKGTSGVLVFIKNHDLHEKMRNEFSCMVAKKIYYCLVQGKLLGSGKIESRLAGAGRKGAQVVFDQQGKIGKLIYEGLAYCNDKDCSLVRVELESGLRHQIRAQLSQIAHPLIGDVAYGGIAAERIALHAYIYQLSIEGREYELQAPLPLFFENFFNLDRFL